MQLEYQKFLFSLNQEIKIVLKGVIQKIYFHGHETRIKGFQVQKNSTKFCSLTYIHHHHYQQEQYGHQHHHFLKLY